jgi:3-keto-5-aminohexanoate cleavage enzyme
MMPMIVNLTPTGMVPTKAMTPYVPISVGEIVEEVLWCHGSFGITSVHLHARDENGQPTYKKEVYGAIIEGIRRKAPELVICVSLSGRNVQDLTKRADPLKLEGALRPDMGSLTLSSLNFSSQASVNDPSVIQALANLMESYGVVPELEIFDLGMVNYARYLLAKGHIRAPLYANIFLGNIAGAQFDLLHAGLLVRDLPRETIWSFGGIGDAQFQANMLAAVSGGGVRVGLEDSIYLDHERQTLATNMRMVERAHHLAKMVGRRVMTPNEFRTKMHMGGQR